MISLTCTRGDTAKWTGTINKNGGPVDLTSARVVMAVRRSWADPILFEKSSDEGAGITVSGTPTNGVFTVELAAADTLQVGNDTVDLVFTVHVIVGSEKNTVGKGTLKVCPTAWDGVS